MHACTLVLKLFHCNPQKNQHPNFSAPDRGNGVSITVGEIGVELQDASAVAWQERLPDTYLFYIDRVCKLSKDWTVLEQFAVIKIPWF